MTVRTLESFPAAAAPRQSQRAAAVAPPQKSRRALLLRGARWQWLAPPGAIAAVLLVWIALHENQPSPLPSLKEVQVPTRHPPPPPAPSVSNGHKPRSPPPNEALNKPQTPA